jgi:prepilin peptidase CpaA
MTREMLEVAGYLTVAQQIAFFALMTVCVYTDIAKDKVYNWATFPAIFAGLALWYIPYGFGGPFMYALAAAGIGGGVFFVFFLFRCIGGGDVKLMAAVGALMGLRFTLNALLPIALVGAVMAVGAMIWKGRVREGLKRSAKMLIKLRPGKPETGAKPLTIPYGAAIAIGGMWTWATLLILDRLPTIANCWGVVRRP